MQKFCKPKVDFPFIFGNSHLIRTKVELWLVYVNELMGEEHYSCGKFQAIWWKKNLEDFSKVWNEVWPLFLFQMFGRLTLYWWFFIIVLIGEWIPINKCGEFGFLSWFFSEDHENENLCCMIYVFSLMFVALCMLFINMSIWWSYDFKG
jgi:hypothetical protein